MCAAPEPHLRICVTLGCRAGPGASLSLLPPTRQVLSCSRESLAGGPRPLLGSCLAESEPACLTSKDTPSLQLIRRGPPTLWKLVGFTESLLIIDVNHNWKIPLQPHLGRCATRPTGTVAQPIKCIITGYTKLLQQCLAKGHSILGVIFVSFHEVSSHCLLNCLRDSTDFKIIQGISSLTRKT